MNTSLGGATMPGVLVTENAPLAERNTFRVPARAAVLIEVKRAELLPAVFGEPGLRREPPLLLGAGSNVLFTRDWPGSVLILATRGIRILEESTNTAVVRVEAGENWHGFVQWSLAAGFAGLENLALIPGTVGAAPIQNIGAYGVEVSEFIRAVEVYDIRANCRTRLVNAECGFAYRNSIFRGEPGRFVVTAVEFRLPRRHPLRLDYPGVREELEAMAITTPSPAAVAEAVVRLRTRKLPNPARIGNAGSFFKNPIVSAAQAEDLCRAHPGLPAFEIDPGRRKLSAAWLIEACGCKGWREGDAGVSDQHALVLVNHGQATGAQILTLAARVQDAVLRRFGVRLEPEPIIV
jgi:UDP-N-acetylmuramate dehydrogenase